jgi:death-on-curing protein
VIEPQWLSVHDIVRLHAMQLSEFGGAVGIRDRNLLEGAVFRPRHRFHYGELCTIVDIAAAYATALNANHPFADGNKRVGFHALLVFLRLHGLMLTAPATEATELMLAVAAGRAQEADLRLWLRSNIGSDLL